MIRTCTAAAGAIAVLACLTGCRASNDAPNHEKRDFSFPGSALTIDVRDTVLTVVSGSANNTVQVERSLEGSATNEGNASWSLQGSTLSLHVECSGVVVSCDSEHTVRIPKGVALTVTGSGTPVRLKALGGDTTATLKDSSLNLSAPAGRLRLRVSGGHLRVTGAASSDVEATTAGDGDVNLSFAAAPRKVEVHAAEVATIVLPEGPETYRIDGAPNAEDLSSDPASDRSVVVRAADGVNLRKAG
ncbi:hypothetical protein ACFQ08_08940 [Streptosporangium algeriense]|uniref:Adhesin domain-containing protein n=1 Tax=Streptosporangium algeriense TaxID=1682748 RepID=A0ABW3DPV7_9ACTN